MAYDTARIKNDADGRPIPQLFNDLTNDYEALKGAHGASRVMLYDIDGNEVNITGLIENLNALLSNMKAVSKTLYGTSDETKPISGNAKGDIYFEIDTTDVFMWDSGNWVVI